MITLDTVIYFLSPPGRPGEGYYTTDARAARAHRGDARRMTVREALADPRRRAAVLDIWPDPGGVFRGGGWLTVTPRGHGSISV